MKHEKSTANKHKYEIEIHRVIQSTEFLNKNELSYSINGKDFGTAFNVNHTEYKAFIDIDAYHEKIQLLQYNHKP